LDLIDTVCAPVGHLATSEIAPLHPPHPIGMKRSLSGLIEPHVPVESFGDFLGWERGGWRGYGTFVGDRADFENFSKATVSDQLASHAVHFHRALLRSDLHNAIRFSCMLYECAAFLDVKREWLFGVDVFAGQAGVDTRSDTLEFPRGDDDCIDIFAVEDLAIIGIDWPIGFYLLTESKCAGLIAIGHRHDLS